VRLDCYILGDRGLFKARVIGMVNRAYAPQGGSPKWQHHHTTLNDSRRENKGTALPPGVSIGQPGYTCCGRNLQTRLRKEIIARRDVGNHAARRYAKDTSTKEVSLVTRSMKLVPKSVDIGKDLHSWHQHRPIALHELSTATYQGWSGHLI
jgi:hypothetical protein